VWGCGGGGCGQAEDDAPQSACVCTAVTLCEYGRMYKVGRKGVQWRRLREKKIKVRMEGRVEKKSDGVVCTHPH